MIAFIDAHRASYGVEPICRVLPIAPSTYHAQVAERADPGKLSARARRDALLQVDTRRVWEANFQVYGVRKVWRQLRREAITAPRCQVARLMKQMGLAGAVRGKMAKTTHSDRAAPCPLDRVNRQFRAPAPNILWVSDFTYVANLAGLRLRRLHRRRQCLVNRKVVTRIHVTDDRVTVADGGPAVYQIGKLTAGWLDASKMCSW